MALATYTDLQASIANWAHRADITSSIPDFIALAEDYFERKVELRAQEGIITGTVPIDGSGTLPLPAGLKRIQKLTVNDGTRDHEIDYATPEDMSRYSGYNARPLKLATINQSAYLLPPPDAAYPYSLYYVAAFTPLSAANPTNWMMTNAPAVYLYGSLKEAAVWTKDWASVDRFQALCDKAIEDVIELDDRVQYPLSALVMRSDVRL